MRQDINGDLAKIETQRPNNAYEFGELDANGNVNQSKNNGNIARQTVTSPAGTFTQSFRYDSLERLKEAKETSGGNQTWIQNFSYDRYGNRVGFNQTINGQTSNGTPTVDVNTNRFTTGQGYVYDFAGNVVQDPQNRQFIFNGDNKQVQVKDANQNVIGTYFYDADGKRIKKVTNTENTTFVYSSGKLVAEYLVTNATPTTPTTQYTATDMLGSPRVITNQSAQVVSRRDFMPFGEDLSRPNYGTDNLRQKFTGYERDNETNLDYAKARMFGSGLGRFTSLDPLMASAKRINPQTFNRYSYVLNNPFRLVDPSGMSPCPPNETCWIDEDGTEYLDSEPIKVENAKNSVPGCGDVPCEQAQNPQNPPVAGFVGPVTPPTTLPPPTTTAPPAVLPTLARGLIIPAAGPLIIILAATQTVQAPTPTTTTTNTDDKERREPVYVRFGPTRKSRTIKVTSRSSRSSRVSIWGFNISSYPANKSP